MRIHPLLLMIFTLRQRFDVWVLNIRMSSVLGCVIVMMVGGAFSPLSVSAQQEVSVPEASVVLQPAPVDPLQILHEKLDFANGLFQREFYDMALTEYLNLIAGYSVASVSLEQQVYDFLPEEQLPEEGFPVLEQLEASSEIVLKSADARYLEEAYIGASESLFFLKKYKDALMKYRETLQKFSKTSQRPIVIVRMGQSLYHIKKYDLACHVFEKLNAGALSGDLRLTYLFYYGVALKAAKQYQKAARVLQRLVKIQSSGAQAWLSFMELADVETLLKNDRKAVVWFDQAFEKADSEQWKSRVLYRKGKAQFDLGKYADALKTFQDLQDKFPDQLIARRGRLSLIATLYQLSQFLEITRFYETHQDVWDFAGNDYEVLKIVVKSFELSRQPKDGLVIVEGVMKMPGLSPDHRKDLLAIQADLLLKTKQFGKLKELTDTVSADLWSDDYRLFLKAEAAYGAGDYSLALQQYESLRQTFPQSEWLSSAVYGAAFSYQQMGQVPEAVSNFNELFNLAPDEQKKRVALYNIVLVYNDTAAWPEAITAAEKFLSVFSEGEYAERVRYLRGYFHFKQTNYEQAIDVLQAFVERYPQSELKSHALFYVGYSYQSEGRAEDAFKFYDKIFVDASDPDLAAAVIKNRALLYLESKQNDKAAQEFHRMMVFVKTANVDPDLMFWLIEYDVSRKDYEAALETLNIIKNQVGGESLLRVHYLTGDVYQRDNQCEKALPEFDLAIQSGFNTQFKGLAYLGKVNCLGQIQKYQEASDVLKLVFDQYREDTFITLRAKFAAARLEENQGNFEQASKLYMFVAVLYKDDNIVPEALYCAGQIFEKLDKRVEAVKAYSEIIQDYPSNIYFSKAQERVKVLQ